MIYLFQIDRHFLDRSHKSPESNLIPTVLIPASIKAFPTITTFRIPDSKVEYESIKAVKFPGNAWAKAKNAANSPSWVLNPSYFLISIALYFNLRPPKLNDSIS